MAAPINGNSSVENAPASLPSEWKLVRLVQLLRLLLPPLPTEWTLVCLVQLLRLPLPPLPTERTLADLTNFKVAKLKSILSSKGLPVSGEKKELVKRLQLQLDIEEKMSVPEELTEGQLVELALLMKLDMPNDFSREDLIALIKEAEIGDGEENADYKAKKVVPYNVKQENNSQMSLL